MTRKPQTADAYHQLGQTLRDLETDLRWGLEGSVRIPAAWHEIAQGPAVPPKDKLTLKLDADVLRFFRAMGRGYTSRINAVLRTFMLARLAEVVKARPDYAPTPQDEERRIRDELFALLAAREAAREASVARLQAEPQAKARLAAARALRAHHLPGGS